LHPNPKRKLRLQNESLNCKTKAKKCTQTAKVGAFSLRLISEENGIEFSVDSHQTKNCKILGAFAVSHLIFARNKRKGL